MKKTNFAVGIENQQRDYMTNDIGNISTRPERYISPQTKIIFVKAYGVLCLSNGNELMIEYYYGDAGFNEEY